jgi:hypothetical protein
MDWRSQYDRAKAALLGDESICPENRGLFTDFFVFQEYKVKRQAGLPDLDDGCCKTLLGYIQRFKNANLWFENKPWNSLIKNDIKRVYDSLEEGTIRTRAGTPFVDRASYYNKVFKAKPFALAGKEVLAREVIAFSTNHKSAVRFVTEETVRPLAGVIVRPAHRLLLWLAWDIGENVDALLKLTKRDFILQLNQYSAEREYVVRLIKGTLKRSRQARSEITLYPETVAAIDNVLAALGPDDPVFTFEYRSAFKFLQRAVRLGGATTQPDGHPVRWKDLRSGMASHLLRCGWSRDEVNARLGHTPHSAALDAYINFLALDRNAPKRRMQANVAIITGTRASSLNCETQAGANSSPPTSNAPLQQQLRDAQTQVEALTTQMHKLMLAHGIAET